VEEEAKGALVDLTWANRVARFVGFFVLLVGIALVAVPAARHV
jgi:hypothetical protein